MEGEDQMDQHQISSAKQSSQKQSVRQLPTSSDKNNLNSNQYLETDENPQQLISEIDPSVDNNIFNLALKAQLEDSQPIRAATFNSQGTFIALGTNSKSLKICAMPNLDDDDGFNLGDEENRHSHRGEGESGVQSLRVIFENENHHAGSVYCIDWSRSSRLIATGSNDRSIKILVCPDLENSQAQSELLVLPLLGHSAIVRTVCFNPLDDLMLLSGGISKLKLNY